MNLNCLATNAAHACQAVLLCMWKAPWTVTFDFILEGGICLRVDCWRHGDHTHVAGGQRDIAQSGRQDRGLSGVWQCGCSWPLHFQCSLLSPAFPISDMEQSCWKYMYGCWCPMSCLSCLGAKRIVHAVQVSEDDILLRKEIDEMEKKHKNFKVHCWHPFFDSSRAETSSYCHIETYIALLGLLKHLGSHSTKS